jgi:hypothetical protein
MNILDLLRSDGSIVVNKRLAHEIGLTEAIIYSELVSLFKYYANRGDLVDGEWFYCTAEKLEKNTALKRKPQDRSIASLEKLGLIKVKKMGLPAKRYFSITDKIYDLFSSGTNKNVQKGQTDNINGYDEEIAEEPHNEQLVQKGQTRMSKRDKQECPKGTISNTNNNTNNNINSNINNIDDDKRTSPSGEDSAIHNEEATDLIISSLREATRDDLSDRSYNTVVRKVVDKYNQGKINNGSFRDYLVTALVNKIEELELRRQKKQAKQQLGLDQIDQMKTKINNWEIRKTVPFYNWLEE